MYAIAFLILAIVCYACGQLALHGKLKWSKEPQGFWGEDSWYRKYKGAWRKEIDGNGWDYIIEDAPTTYYYKLFNLKHKERFPGSATFLVAYTDGYHLCQSLSFICLALSFSLATGLNFFIVWGGILLCHFATYKFLQRDDR